jgi:hypothetical protein
VDVVEDDTVSFAIDEKVVKVGGTDDEDEDGERSEKILSRFGFKSDVCVVVAPAVVVVIDDDDVGDDLSCDTTEWGTIALTADKDDEDSMLALLLLPLLL